MVTKLGWRAGLASISSVAETVLKRGTSHDPGLCQNAEHNDAADVDELIVSQIMIDEGPIMKRFRARARGRANQILKRMSHVTVAVEEVE